MCVLWICLSVCTCNSCHCRVRQMAEASPFHRRFWSNRWTKICSCCCCCCPSLEKAGNTAKTRRKSGIPMGWEHRQEADHLTLGRHQQCSNSNYSDQLLTSIFEICNFTFVSVLKRKIKSINEEVNIRYNYSWSDTSIYIWWYSMNHSAEKCNVLEILCWTLYTLCDKVCELIFKI